MRYAFPFFVTLAIFAVGACDSTEVPPEPEADYATSFEGGFGSWQAHGIDLMVGGEEVDWDIEHAPETGAQAPGAVRLHLENNTDAGKIWIERAFSLVPNTTYDIDLSYAFGTTDYSGVNAWTIITGAHQESPETQDDLTFQGSTDHSAGEGADLVWLDKNYTLTAETDDEGRLYVAIGVWGTYEVPRTYYVDDLRIDYEQQ